MFLTVQNITASYRPVLQILGLYRNDHGKNTEKNQLPGKKYLSIGRKRKVYLHIWKIKKLWKGK